VNTWPPFRGVNRTIASQAASPAVVLAPAATVTDPDSTNFNTGYLQVNIVAGGLPADVLNIRNQGTGLGKIGVSGSTVTYSGAPIGTFTGGTGGAQLAIAFNAAATPTAATALA